MLDLVAPRIAPVIKNLAAQVMPPDAPMLGIGAVLQVLVAGHQIVEIRHFEGRMHECRRHRKLQQEQRMVVAGLVAAIAAQERTDGHLRGGMNFIRRDKSETLLVPRLGAAEIADAEHHVAQAQHVRRPLVHPADHALAWIGAALIPRDVRLERDRGHIVLPEHRFHHVAVRIAQPHHRTTAGIGEHLDIAALGRGKALEIAPRRQLDAEPGETRLPPFRHVHERGSAVPAHIQPVLRADCFDHSEVAQELPHHREIRRAEADIGDVVGFQLGHWAISLGGTVAATSGRETL